MDFRTRLTDFARQHRKRLASLAALVGLVFIGSQLLRQLPTDTHIRYELGPDHATYREVRIAFSRGDETTVRSLSRRFPEGAPASFDDTVALGRGRYLVHAMLIDEAGQPTGILRGIELPTEGVLRIELFRSFATSAP